MRLYPCYYAVQTKPFAFRLNASQTKTNPSILFTLYKCNTEHSHNIAAHHRIIMRWPDLNFFRDNFGMTTWLLFGACIQSCLVLLLGNVGLLPAVVVLAGRVATSVLRSTGFLPNPHADRVVFGRATARTPNDDGTFSKGIADKEICVFVLAGRSNQ